MQFAGECIYEVGAIPFAGEIDAWLNSHPCLRFLKLRFAKQSTTKSTNTTKKMPVSAELTTTFDSTVRHSFFVGFVVFRGEIFLGIVACATSKLALRACGKTSI